MTRNARVVDIMMAFPGILMALVVVAVLGQGTINMMLAVGVSLIPTFVRLVRGDVLSVRENAYVEAARALGCWPARVALRHVPPNVVAPIIVISMVAIAWAIILGASLSFLGLRDPRATTRSARRGGTPSRRWWSPRRPAQARGRRGSARRRRSRTARPPAQTRGGRTYACDGRA